MYKLVVLLSLTTLFAVALARPGYLDAHVGPTVYYSSPSAIVHEPAYAKVGTIIKSIPTSVTHHSHAIVHSSAHVVQPILAPVVKTTAYLAPQWNAWSPKW